MLLTEYIFESRKHNFRARIKAKPNVVFCMQGTADGIGKIYAWDMKHTADQLVKLIIKKRKYKYGGLVK